MAQVELNDKEVQLILELARIAWESGAVRNPQLGMEIGALAQKVTQRSPLEEVQL